VASIDDVKTIEEIEKISFNNWIAREDIGIEAKCPAYFPWRISKNMYDGRGEIVVVSDSGFDLGFAKSTKTVKVHPAFHNRVIEVLNKSKLSSAEDKTGHGTHVCGSVVGNGISQQFGSIKGTAPKAKLVVQCIFGEDLKNQYPPILTEIFVDPYRNRNAHTFTNSWGATLDPGNPQQFDYNGSSELIDDIMYKNDDLLILFAAGNDGNEARLAQQIGAE